MSYFPKETQADDGKCWILNLFWDSTAEVADLSTAMKEKLLELEADSMLKLEFLSHRLTHSILKDSLTSLIFNILLLAKKITSIIFLY